MNLTGMRFRGFTWKDNPTKLSVEFQRNMKESVLPFAGSRIEDLGRLKRRIAGEGYFSGPDCGQQWAALEREFAKGGRGTLQLPGQEPFTAAPEELELIGSQGKDILRYRFVFREVSAGAEYDGRGTHRAAAGETLWDYAWRYGRSIEAMIGANPQIRDILCLKEGEEVLVP